MLGVADGVTLGVVDGVTLGVADGVTLGVSDLVTPGVSDGVTLGVLDCAKDALVTASNATTVAVLSNFHIIAASFMQLGLRGCAPLFLQAACRAAACAAIA
jgi:hypothetical protein